MNKESNVAAAAGQFEISGEFIEAKPYGSGHINDTYQGLSSRNGDGPPCHILQRINHKIFKRPVALMENIQRVTAHLATQVANEPDSGPSRFRLIPARDGRAWHVDAEDNYWRAYYFIERARSLRCRGVDRAGVPGCKGVWPIPAVAGQPARSAPARYNPRLSPRSQATEGAGGCNCGGRGRPRHPCEARDRIFGRGATQSITSVLLDANLP